jgi:cytochrome c oxidase subunit 2
MKLWNMAGRYALLFAAMALILSGCGGALDPKGKVAQDQYFLIMLSFLVMLVVMIVVFVLFFYVIVRFRKRKNQTGYPEQVEGNHKLEIIWTLIPFVLIMVLAVFTVAMTFEQDKQADPETSVNVKVIAHQYWWEFIYDDYNIRTAQDLVLPENTWVNAELTSVDVIHSFWIPQLAGKLDANPGLTKTLPFKTAEAGIFLGKCAELCGESHALMDFKVVVKSDAEFKAWVDKMKTPASVPSDATVQAGQEIYTTNCISCHAVTTDSPSMGPNLAGFADREKVAGFRDNTDEWLKEWIRDPLAVKPGVLMPGFGDILSDQEINDLTAYLRTLK